jgi:tripartite-type tricarboxylate transporter receptor subunit TctC
METWFGLFAPAKAPAPVIEKLRGAVAEIMKSPAVRATFEKSGGTLLDMKPAETEAFVKAEITKWTKLVRDAGVTAE